MTFTIRNLRKSRKLYITTLLFCLGAGLTLFGGCSKKLENPDDVQARFSYALGQNLGDTMRRQGYDLDLNVFTKSFKKAFSGKKSKLSREEMQHAMMKYRDMQSEKKRVDAQQFMEEHKKKEGFSVTDSGLQYKIIKEGTGPSPVRGNSVTVHYEGKLTDGRVFDSSYNRGEPASFKVDGVIQGWTEALLMMKRGAKYQLVIPPELGYGQRGAGNGEIPPWAVLIFEVELLDFK